MPCIPHHYDSYPWPAGPMHELPAPIAMTWAAVNVLITPATFAVIRTVRYHLRWFSWRQPPFLGLYLGL